MYPRSYLSKVRKRLISGLLSTRGATFLLGIAYQVQDRLAWRNHRVKLIYGWKTSKEFTWESSATMGEALAFAGVPAELPDEIYYRGYRIAPTMTWHEFCQIADKTKPLELVGSFIQSFDDGNFNSKHTTTAQDEDFRIFRNSETFHFLTADVLGENREYNAAARAMNPTFTGRATCEYLESSVGWEDGELTRREGHVLGSQTYVHLYYAAAILRFVTRPKLKVLEIGGGYGGLARVFGRLAPDRIHSYTIVDIPLVTELQRYFLEDTFSGEIAVNPQSESASKVKIFDINHATIPLQSGYDLVIATHSLSELDPKQINYYVEGALSRAQNVLLSLQLKFHSNLRGYCHQDCSWIVDTLRRCRFQTVFENRTEGGRGTHNIADEGPCKR